MKIKDLTEFLLNVSKPWCEGSMTDSLKFGNDEKEIKKLAVCCIATPEILRSAISWGADLLVTHEPTFYGDGEFLDEDIVSREKYDIIKNSDMAIFRFHDRAHTHNPDIIAQGFIDKLGLKGKYDYIEHGISSFECDEEMTAFELKKLIEEKAGLKNIKICGETKKKSKKLVLCLGAINPPKELELLKRDDTQIMLCGETWEWMIGEYARDAKELGINKSVLLIGHMSSEKSGMEFLAKKLNEKYDFDTKYFDCGEVYS